MRRRLVGVQGPGQHAVPHRQDHLDDPGDAGGGLGVPDVRLDRAEPQRVVAGRSWPYVASSACASIGSPSVVPVPCASTASTSPARSPASASACADDPLLRGAVRGGQAVGGAVLVDRGAADDGEDRVAVALARRRAARAASTPTPSAQPVPSASAANALQRPSAASPPLAAELDERAGGGHHGDAAGQRQRRTRRGAAPAPARCSATSDDEQAVSTVTAGPSRPSA